MHNKPVHSLNRCAFVIVSAMLLLSCGGAGGSNEAANNPNHSSGSNIHKTGVFIDNTVSGIDYTSPSFSGTTNALGQFSYQDNDIITFKIGDIVLGSTIGNDLVSPLDLAQTENGINTTKLINLLRLLQTLDEDNDTSNGISITPETHQAAIGVTIDFNLSLTSFESNADLGVFLQQITTQELTDISSAVTHFRSIATNDSRFTDENLNDIPVSEQEPNDTSKTPQQINLPSVIAGSLNSASDIQDYFEFTPTDPGVYVFELSELVADAGSEISWIPPAGETRQVEDLILENTADNIKGKITFVAELLDTSYQYKVYTSDTGGLDIPYLLKIHKSDNSSSYSVDKIPDPFQFEDLEGVQIKALTTSNEITIVGINAPASVAVEGGDYSIGCTSTFTRSIGLINNGQTICVRHITASSSNTSTNTVLTVGGVSDTFSTTTPNDPSLNDTIPNSFRFNTQTIVPISTLITSNPVVIEGINAPTPITVFDGGEYSIGCTPIFTSAPQTILNGQTICVRLTSASSYLTSKEIRLEIGSVTGKFRTTTESPP